VLTQQVPQATSLLGKPLYSAPPSADLVARCQQRKTDYEANPDDADALIWYARFLAYQGDYLSAIDTYTRGIERFPRDPRMYRHRGHRYITIRKFDQAIADMDQAIRLIAGQPNQMEPDGMPNALNIPISTLHGNIYYHKGLAHYLQHDFPQALAAFQKCLELKTNDDNIVSATHWIYMILRRMGKEEEAQRALAPINKDLQIVENFSYHRACLFYKGELSLAETTHRDDTAGDSPADDALRYAVANWHFYNGSRAEAQAAFERLVAGDLWQSFGHIAAEADLARMKD
jgi:tetratricopeptide (TPR) repeat protein